MKGMTTNRSRDTAMTTYLFLPLLLKFSDWTLTGRSILFLIGPSALLLMFGNIFQKKFNLKTKIIFWRLIFFSLTLSHGMGRILFVFGILTWIINLIYTYQKLKNNSRLYI